MLEIKQSISVKVVIGPVVDVTDGFTPVTTLSLSSADEAEIMKHDSSTVTSISGNTISAITGMDGYYNVTLTAAQTDTKGMLVIGINDDSLCRPVRHEYMVVDAVAGDNIDDTYNGTGYVDDAAPSTQGQVGSFTVGSSSISVQAESYTLAKGVQSSGTVSDTETLDGVEHVHTDTSGAMDLYYQFDVRGNGIGSDLEITGRVNGNGDDLSLQAYNWAASSWDDLGDLEGRGSNQNQTQKRNLLIRHTGTDANLGKVRIRLFAASGLTNATLSIDSIYVSLAIITTSVGYALGRVWVDTVNGVAGTENFVNGVADNPVDTLARAATIAGNLNIYDYHITSNSSLTLTSALNDVNLYGVGYSLDFNGQDCSGTHFYHASPVDGIFLSGGSDHVDILDSIINNVTCGDSHFTSCSFKGTLTFGSVSSDVRVIDSRSVIAGTTSPIFDFGTAVGISHNFTVADWQSGIEIHNFNASGTDEMSLSGIGKLIIDSSCVGGEIQLRGIWEVIGEDAFITNGGLVIRDDSYTNGDDALKLYEFIGLKGR